VITALTKYDCVLLNVKLEPASFTLKVEEKQSEPTVTEPPESIVTGELLKRFEFADLNILLALTCMVIEDKSESITATVPPCRVMEPL
jgi:hypothetical protein